MCSVFISLCIVLCSLCVCIVCVCVSVSRSRRVTVWLTGGWAISSPRQRCRYSHHTLSLLLALSSCVHLCVVCQLENAVMFVAVVDRVWQDDFSPSKLLFYSVCFFGGVMWLANLMALVWLHKNVKRQLEVLAFVCSCVVHRCVVWCVV